MAEGKGDGIRCTKYQSRGSRGRTVSSRLIASHCQYVCRRFCHLGRQELTRLIPDSYPGLGAELAAASQIRRSPLLLTEGEPGLTSRRVTQRDAPGKRGKPLILIRGSERNTPQPARYAGGPLLLTEGVPGLASRSVTQRDAPGKRGGPIRQGQTVLQTDRAQ